MDKIIKNLKEYSMDSTKRIQHIWIVTGIVAMISTLFIFTGGRKEKLVDNTMNFVEAKTSTWINNHSYRELPWDVLLTKEDEMLLIKEEIPKLPELAINEQDVLTIVESFNLLSNNTTLLLRDKELYANSLDNPSILKEPLSDIYKNEKIYEIYKELLDGIYSKDYTYPDEMYLVSLKQEISGPSAHEWIANFEMRTLQDSKDYLVYPITLTFDNEYQYINGAIGDTFESPSGTRPLDDQSLITEDSHKSFINEFKQFSVLFNKDIYSGKTDTIHLDTMATENVPIELLNEMYESSFGDLSNASITSWEMNDRKAEAITNYRLDIPKDSNGNVLSINIEFSRPYNEILTMEVIN